MRTKAGILVSHCPPPSTPLCGPGLKIWKGGVHATKIMIHYQYKFLGVHFVQFKEEKLIQLGHFFPGEKQNFVYHKDFARRRVT